MTLTYLSVHHLMNYYEYYTYEIILQAELKCGSATVYILNLVFLLPSLFIYRLKPNFRQDICRQYLGQVRNQ
jgi:hypothetical protein